MKKKMSEKLASGRNLERKHMKYKKIININKLGPQNKTYNMGKSYLGKCWKQENLTLLEYEIL